MQHNRITINQEFAKSNRKGKDELLKFFDELREIEGIWKTYFGKDADALVPIKEILKE